MSTLTPAQRGIKLRLAASRERSAGHDDTADMIDELADQIDPKPEYPEGTVAWVHAGPHRTICRRESWGWTAAYPVGGAAHYVFVEDADVTKVEPFRVLGDDEIALPRAAFEDGTPKIPHTLDAATARSWAAQERVSNREVFANVFDAYAEAVDAEAGER